MLSTARAAGPALDERSTVLPSRTAVLSPDWGEESFPVFECLRVVVGEHAEHLRFALRDLAVLVARAG